MCKKTGMNYDIREYGVYSITGKFLPQIKNTSSYNHFIYNCHHYIKNQHYIRNPQWFVQRGIKQKLILLPVKLHADLHSAMSNERFKELYNIERKYLLYSRKEGE